MEPHQIEAVAKAADADGNQCVNLHEFKMYFRNPDEEGGPKAVIVRTRATGALTSRAQTDRTRDMEETKEEGVLQSPCAVLPLTMLHNAGNADGVPEHLIVGDRTKVGELTIAGTAATGYAGNILGGDVITAQAGQPTTVVPKGMLLKQGRYLSGRYYFEVMLLQTAAQVTVGIVDTHYLSKVGEPNQNNRVKAEEETGPGFGDAKDQDIQAPSGRQAPVQQTGDGIGSDCHSWGICGHRSQCGAKHAGKLRSCGSTWAPGDVVGVLVDLGKSTIAYTVNGVDVCTDKWRDEAAIMTPAVTLEYGSCVQLNLGTNSGFWFTPPDNSVAACLRSLEMQREWVADNAAVLGLPLTIANAENVELYRQSSVLSEAPPPFRRADPPASASRMLLKENVFKSASAFKGDGLFGKDDWKAKFVDGDFKPVNHQDDLKGKGTKVMSGGPGKVVVPGWCDHGATFTYSEGGDEWQETNNAAPDEPAKTWKRLKEEKNDDGGQGASIVVTDGLLLTRDKHFFEVTFDVNRDPSQDAGHWSRISASFGWWSPDDRQRKVCIVSCMHVHAHLYNNAH